MTEDEYRAAARARTPVYIDERVLDLIEKRVAARARTFRWIMAGVVVFTIGYVALLV